MKVSIEFILSERRCQSEFDVPEFHELSSREQLSMMV